MVLGDAVAPISEGAPENTVPLLFGFLLIPMTGIVATSERIHAILIVIATGITLLNFGRL